MGAPLYELVKTPAGAEPATVKTLVVTDLVGSTRLFATLGDRRAARLSARHERMARDLLVRCGGREIDKTDGFLLLFERTVDALRFALGYHRALEALSKDEELEIAARVGIHLGEVIQRKNAPEDVARGAKPLEIEGFAKPIAARVMALAKGRQTLLTRGAFDLARLAAARERVTDGELRWLAHGPYLLKGVSDPVEIFEVGERGFAPLLVPKSTAKARRAVKPEDELTLGWRPAPGLEVPRRARWRLVEKLGEGGFGEVWRAQHEKTGENRVFKFCYRTDSLRSLQREVTLFRLLKETLGSRDDIARILDWSFDEAPYFLECEYTAGGNLLEWVVDQGGPSAVPLATKLELMAQVADALASAHSVGVLHKDVKPSNVLITTGSGGRPQVRLTDFGIGLLTDREALARQGITVFDLTEMVADTTGSIGGTHLYMAPELVEGRNATVQADIYAVGVMLYQFVIGDFSHALAPGWRRDVPDEILQEDLAAMVDGHPERRMRDAQRVAERLRTLEERREAREAALRERREREAERVALEKAHRRRKVSAVVAAAALVVLAVVSFLALQALDARQEADRRRGQAEGLIGFMVGDLRQKLEPIGRLDVLDEVGEAALDYFESVPEDDLTDVELFRRSETLRQIGEVRVSRGNLAEALDAYVESRAVARRLVERDPGNGEWQKGLGESHFGVGLIHWRQNDPDQAMPEFQAYLEIARTLTELDPENPDWQMELAYAHSNLGSILEGRGDLEEALEAQRSSLEIRERLVRREPSHREWHSGLATAHNKVGSLLEQTGQLARAREHYRADLEIQGQLLAATPDDSHLERTFATAHSYMANLLLILGDASGAESHYQTAREILAGLVERDPSNARWRRNHAMVRARLGELSRLRGQLRQALAETEAALATLDELASSDPADAHWQVDLALVRRNVGEIQLAASNAAAALSSFESSLRILDERLEARPDDPYLQYEIAVGRTLLGDALEQYGGRAEARHAWREALGALEDQMATARDPRVLAAWVRPLLRLGDAERAAPILQRLRAMGFRYPGAFSMPAGGDDPPLPSTSLVGPDNPAPDGAPNSRRST